MKYNSKNFVVIGASSHLGKEIVRYLADEQNCNVLGISRRDVDWRGG